MQAIGGKDQLPPDLRAQYDEAHSGLSQLDTSGSMVVPGAKVKNLLTQIREQGQAYKKGIGEAKGTEYNLNQVRDGARSMNERLKDNVPGYRAHMDGVATKTRAYKEVAGRFKDETATRNAVRRMMLGKDPEGLRALRDMDAAAGTNHAQELQDSFVKEQFSKERINGSRRTLLGGAVGAGIGAMMGQGPIGSVLGSAAGTAAGATADVMGGKAAKALLDLASTPYLGRVGDMLNRAARKSPQAVLAVHRWGMENDRAYAEKINSLTEEPQD